MIGKIFKFLVIGVLALVGIGVALSLLGLAFGLAMLALKVGIVVAIGYGVVRLLGGGRKKQPEISEADRKWLES
ncbi:MAG: hypothetical protein ACT443_01050 [Gemmatimonadota bacterium]